MSMTDEHLYPEHTKLARIRTQATIVKPIVEALINDERYVLCDADTDSYDGYSPTEDTIEDILFYHFGIDRNKLAAEVEEAKQRAIKAAIIPDSRLFSD